ncbi:hypothetical protein [Actinoallomurus iriomotensis]|uniref:Uncharacterized protein n=1 Tax=Actinoallomurus iriomotensis TaxID=478107 RepID=A0A9W6RVH3_9ACTN|nr:hypothetical protein [Actinoallomurus iriomotensis]GLY83381.1 hypothetical protein Airi02_013110 [Actinoallomurus iriomotensis]
MRMVDERGRRVEVIVLDLGDGLGPRQWICVSRRRVLLGRGYYRAIADVLALVLEPWTLGVPILPANEEDGGFVVISRRVRQRSESKRARSTGAGNARYVGYIGIDKKPTAG